GLQREAAQAAPRQRVAELEERLEGVNRQLAALKAAQARPKVQPKRASAPPRRTARPATVQMPERPDPPFAPLGVESRGGERFLAVSPLDGRTLESVQLLAIGEHASGWRLKRL